MFKPLMLGILLSASVLATETPLPKPQEKTVHVTVNIDDIGAAMEVNDVSVILLMKIPGTCKDDSLTAYYVTKSGTGVEGCWTFDENDVNIAWEGGNKNSFSRSRFTRVIQTEPTPAPTPLPKA